MVKGKVVRWYNDCSYMEWYVKGVLGRNERKRRVFVKGLYFVNIW